MGKKLSFHHVKKSQTLAANFANCRRFFSLIRENPCNPQQIDFQGNTLGQIAKGNGHSLAVQKKNAFDHLSPHCTIIIR